MTTDTTDTLPGNDLAAIEVVAVLPRLGTYGSMTMVGPVKVYRGPNARQRAKAHADKLGTDAMVIGDDAGPWLGNWLDQLRGHPAAPLAEVL